MQWRGLSGSKSGDEAWRRNLKWNRPMRRGIRRRDARRSGLDVTTATPSDLQCSGAGSKDILMSKDSNCAFSLSGWGNPAQWKRPRMIFVNSMSDLFHKEIPTAYIDAVFDAMETADWHVYHTLTGRSSIMRNYVNRRHDVQRSPSHIWPGLACQ